MKGQAFAICAVITAGVSMFVMFLTTLDSLSRTQAAYYERNRFADVFANLKRAPGTLEARIAEIPGVSRVRDARGAAGDARHAGDGAAGGGPADLAARAR